MVKLNMDLRSSAKTTVDIETLSVDVRNKLNEVTAAISGLIAPLSGAAKNAMTQAKFEFDERASAMNVVLNSVGSSGGNAVTNTASAEMATATGFGHSVDVSQIVGKQDGTKATTTEQSTGNETLVKHLGSAINEASIELTKVVDELTRAITAMSTHASNMSTSWVSQSGESWQSFKKKWDQSAEDVKTECQDLKKAVMQWESNGEASEKASLAIFSGVV